MLPLTIQFNFGLLNVDSFNPWVHKKEAKSLHIMYVHSNMIHSSFRIDTVLIPTNWEMDRQDLAHPHKRILFSHENKVVEQNYKHLFSVKEARHRHSVSPFHSRERFKGGKALGIESSFSGCQKPGGEMEWYTVGSYWWHKVSCQYVMPVRQCKQNIKQKIGYLRK